MGFNTTVVVLNDVLGEIEKDEKFGEKLADAIKSLSGPDPVSMLGGGVKVLETHHNSSVAVVAVGGNYGTVLAWGPDVSHHTHEGQEKLLKALAEKLGYRLTKKT